MPRTRQQPATPLIRAYADAKALEVSPEGVYNAVATLNRAEAYLRQLDPPSSLRDATREELTGFLRMRRAEVCANTVITNRTYLRSFYAWACEGDDPYLETNPSRSLPKIKANDPDPDKTHVTEEWEFRALLATCRRKTRDGERRSRDRRDAAILELMWDTGLRRAEVSRIDMRHVDWDACTIHLVRTKGRTATRSRDIVLGPDAMAALTKYVFERGEHAGPLFESTHVIPGTTTRRRLAANSITLMLQRRAREANEGGKLPGVVRAVAHGFRRASTINDIDDDISARAIQHQKGWGDGRMLGKYAQQAERRQSHDEYRAKRGRRHLRAVEDAG